MLQYFRPFQERHTIAPACTRTCAKTFTSVIDCTWKSCFYKIIKSLIKICAYSHATIKHATVFDYQFEVTFITILTLKAVDFT